MNLFTNNENYETLFNSLPDTGLFGNTNLD